MCRVTAGPPGQMGQARVHRQRNKASRGEGCPVIRVADPDPILKGARIRFWFLMEKKNSPSARNF